MVLEVEPRLAPLFARSFPAGEGDRARARALFRAGRGAGAARRPRPVPAARAGSRSRSASAAISSRTKRARQALRPRIAGDGAYRHRPVLDQQGADRRRAEERAACRLRGAAATSRATASSICNTATPRAERDAVERELGIRVERLPDIDNTNDLDGLAALMCACDAVVTVSNTTAHLAGALGRPTWVMVPHGHARIWYWFSDRDGSPWYPRVQVRRQRRGQPWAELIAAVREEVSQSARSERDSTRFPHRFQPASERLRLFDEHARGDASSMPRHAAACAPRWPERAGPPARQRLVRRGQILQHLGPDACRAAPAGAALPRSTSWRSAPRAIRRSASGSGG